MTINDGASRPAWNGESCPSIHAATHTRTGLKGQEMEIEVFPTVGAVTVDFNGEWLTITQYSTEGHDPEVVVIPNRLTDLFLEAISRSMGI